MRKLLSIALLAVTSIGYGQGVFVHNENIISGLKGKELQVVIPDNSYGKFLKEAVTSYWKASKFKFITEKELEGYEDKTDVYLLGEFLGQFTAHSYDLSNIPFIGIIHPYTTKNKYFYKKKNLLAHVMLPVENISEEKLKSAIILHVKTLNYLIKTGGYKAWYPAMNKLKTSVKKKTVLILKEDMKGELSDIQKKYSGKLKIVEQAEYDKAILGEEEVLLLSALRDNSMYSCLSVVSNKGKVYWSDLNHSVAKKDWDKEFLVRFFDNLN